MIDYGIELFQRYNLKDYSDRFNIVIVNEKLDPDDFLPQTIFINVSNRQNIKGKLLELKLKENIKIDKCKVRKCCLPDIPIFDHSHILPDGFKEEGVLLASIGSINADGLQSFPAVLEFSGSRFVINFDIYEAINFIRKEGYFIKKRPFYTYAPINIQKVPPGIRQLAFRCMRGRKDYSAETIFPLYFKDYSVELLTNIFLHCVQKIIKIDVNLNIWPNGKKYAFVLTHDVDSKWVYQKDNLKTFFDTEEQVGVKGAWFFVGNLYKHDFEKIDFLFRQGHEIGLHGDNHDHKIAFLSKAHINKRLSMCRSFIDRYEIIGFRSPHYLRTPCFYEILKDYVKYDTSMHDSYNSISASNMTREGCSTVYPFKLSDCLLEIPITIPEDFELYKREKGPDSIVMTQLEQINEVKTRNGIALLVIHPEPHLSSRKDYFEAFKEVLRAVSMDSDCWICRPKDIYNYWINKFCNN